MSEYNGQSFGFTQEDVAVLRWCAEGYRLKAMDFVDRPGLEMWSNEATCLESIADRIEALPPLDAQDHQGAQGERP